MWLYNVFLFPQQAEKEQEILTLRQHIQILQQEHLTKISRIAELEAQLQYLRVMTTILKNLSLFFL